MVDLPTDFLTRTWADITSGRHAPLAFRFILQPAVAAFLAYRAGRRDALDGRPLYFLALLRDQPQRRALIREGWGHVSKVFIVAIVMDSIYQFVVMHWVYPVEALMVALVLAVLPYLLFRSLVNWMLRRKRLG